MQLVPIVVRIAAPAVLAGFLLCSLRVEAQQSELQEKEFLVASVKRSSVQKPAMPAFAPNRLRYNGITLLALMRYAYGRSLPHEIEGGPRWIDSEYFDIEGTMPASTPPEDYPAMLRRLLRDRFQLVTTVMQKEMAAEALVLRRADRLGPRIRRSDVDCSSIDLADTIRTKPGEPRLCARVTDLRRSAAGLRVVTVHGRSVGMHSLRDYLSGARRIPVVDHTGLSGVFDFDLEFQDEFQSATADATPAR